MCNGMRLNKRANFYEFIVNSKLLVDLKNEIKEKEREEEIILNAYPCNNFYLQLQGMKDYLPKSVNPLTKKESQRNKIGKENDSEEKILNPSFFEWVNQMIKLQ